MAIALARHCGYGGLDEAYLTGLLHNVGELVIASNFSSEYRYSSAASGYDLLSQERRQFGFNRYDAGAWLVGQWKLRPVVSEAISSQQEPHENIRDADVLVKIIFLASRLANDSYDKIEEAYFFAQQLFGLANEPLNRLMCETDEEVARIASSMSIDFESEWHRPASDLPKEGAQVEDGRQYQASSELVSLVRNQARIETIRLLIATAETEQELINTIQVGVYVLYGYQQVLLFVPGDNDSKLVDRVASIYRRRGRHSDVSISVQDESSAIAKAFRQKIPTESIIGESGSYSSIVDHRVSKLCSSAGILCLPIYDKNKVFGVLVVGVREYKLTPAQNQPKMLHQFCRIAGMAFGQIRKTKTLNDHALRPGQVMEPDRLRSLVHEVNNPLSILKSYIDILDTKFEGAHREELSIIGAEIDRIARIIKQISEDSRESFDENVDLNALILNLIKLYQESYFVPNKVKIIFIPGDQVGNISVNVDTLKQILVNLLKNSTESILESGKIKITTKGVVMVRGKPCTEIVVADTGWGIPREIIDKLFLPTISSKGKKRGIGLFIVKNLITDMGGFIHCKTRIGKGTSFQVLLPTGLSENQNHSEDKLG